MLLRLIISQGHLIPPLFVVVEDPFQSDVPKHCSTGHLHHLREYVETAAPLPTVGVKSATVIRMTVTRQSLNKMYSVSHQNQRKKLRRHMFKDP